MTRAPGGGGKPMPLERRALLQKGDGIDPSQRGRVALAGKVVRVPLSLDERPPVPPALGPAGRAQWDLIWSQTPWLQPMDARLVELIATEYDRIAEWDEIIKAEGPIIRGSAGGRVINPCITARHKSELLIVKLLSILGLTPTDRARLQISEVRKQTGLADLQARTTGK